MQLLRRAILALMLLFPGLHHGHAESNTRNVRPPAGDPSDERQVEIRHETLEDILARQAGRRDPRLPRDVGSAEANAADMRRQLGTLGGVSDAGVWEALRFNEGSIVVSAGGVTARTVIQDGGMWWWKFREGPLSTYGAWLLLGMLGFLLLFFLFRGRIRLAGGLSGERILRFHAIERFAHWLLAGSFIILAITGLISLFGRRELIPLFGKEDYATLAMVAKWSHNNISWAFMLGLVMVFFLWVLHNIPDRHDLVWLARGGGLIGRGHAPAKKFNAGQKLIFWSVILLGGSISVSGIALLFPFQLEMMAPTFSMINDWGVPGWIGMEPLPVRLTPQEEMQYTQLWHSIVAFLLMAIIIAHIYIGTIGMEGAYAAMGDGKVDLNWAREHHDLWVEDVLSHHGAGASGRSRSIE
ncbi:MAG: formate dehydrogenase subunit gamma [Geminicoccaceae bacterium]|nr:formate dehydrogenase subunit gamma [Geminicoccaceae bacterium]